MRLVSFSCLAEAAMDSVLTSALLDSYITQNGLRLICIDKPGVGKTPSCPLNERVTSYAGMSTARFPHEQL